MQMKQRNTSANDSTAGSGFVWDEVDALDGGAGEVVAEGETSDKTKADATAFEATISATSLTFWPATAPRSEPNNEAVELLLAVGPGTGGEHGLDLDPGSGNDLAADSAPESMALAAEEEGMLEIFPPLFDTPELR